MNSFDDPNAGTAGPYRLLVFDEIGSTNDEAMARVRNRGDPGGLVIRAIRQTGGRGRQGRTWQSPAGNLYASIALRLSIHPAVAPQLGFVAGVALAATLRARLGCDARLQLKWPNDLLFDGAKLAGLLLESTALPGGDIACIAGFGVNCRSHPDNLSYPATDLATAGDSDPDPSRLLIELSKAMAEQVALWDAGRGFAQVRTAWLSRAIETGTPLVVRLPQLHMSGSFQGIDATGRLLLQTEDDVVVIDAGDVFVVREPSLSKALAR